MAEKTCIVGLTRGISGAFEYGWHFEELTACCEQFRRWFETGNRKLTTFNQASGEENNGFNLVTRANQPSLVLRVKTGEVPAGPFITEDRINFCPFCATRVEVKVVKVVELKDKFEKKRVGFEEIVLHPKPEVNQRIYEGDLR